MILESILFILFLVLLNFIYLFYIQYKKTQHLLRLLESMSDHVVFVYKKMKEIDRKEMFEHDDEVGVLFSKLKELINSFEYFIEKDDNGSQKKK